VFDEDVGVHLVRTDPEILSSDSLASAVFLWWTLDGALPDSSSLWKLIGGVGWWPLRLQVTLT
jgi:hypothetical protein